MKEWMFESLDYDEWANLRWAEALPVNLVTGAWAERVALNEPWPDFPTNDPGARCASIFAHILWAERIWLMRCGVDVRPENPADCRSWLTPLTDAWRQIADRRDMFERITYKNTAGVEGRRTLGEIARHVLNHSTYHRGQLRDAAEQLGGIDLPSTDLILFFASRDRRVS